MERVTTKSTEQKSYTIYAGLFDVREVGCGTFANPIGVGYCDPERGSIHIATATEGRERQLHETFASMNGLFIPSARPPHPSNEARLNFQKKYSLPPEFRSLHSSDGADFVSLNEISSYTHRHTTNIFPVSLGENPDLPPEEQERYKAIRPLAALALAAVLHYKLYEELPSKNTMYKIDIPDEFLVRYPDIVIHR